MGSDEQLERRLATRLTELRVERGWSLEQLARRADVSRSTLSRLERSEISPTTALLARLCAAHGQTMSRLLAEVESEPPPLVRADQQAVWQDGAADVTRRSVSPPHPGLRGEVVETVLGPAAETAHGEPPVPGLEQHLWVLDGALEVSVDGTVHELGAGDCLRFRRWGGSRFRNASPVPARYALLTVLP